ncbi:tripartite tricarboxylate transporter TctB family protein [Massilia yuzhufengensis]|uniref:Tripartite tricarboxylate transporter TctB family protein n=1 Tax=Massilia yuzhufengensis TaxID=1164594 RepID=A0A1I1N7L3_9BURK|nr:tripartite tricarboxylate transporter TctB family protein [Massilia yuzhufengensis]SFC93435.1 Tripartite tricarboxylate transporter TctB family protein [Massilia yuzhufengensis]
MTSIVRHPQNFWIGIIFLFFGLAAVYFGWELEMGTAGRMGPAYFPSVLGALLAVVGLANVIRSFIGHGETIGKFHVKNIVIILAAVLLFGALMRTAGLAVAAFVLILLSSWASPKFELKGSLLLAVGLTIFAVVLFVKLLGLPMPILGPWFTGA